MKMRYVDFGHALGVTIALPYAHNFVPTPNMTPTEIASRKGEDAARRGLREDANPYDKTTHASLYEHWMGGFNNAAAKADPTRRLKSGIEPVVDSLDPPGDEESASTDS